MLWFQRLSPAAILPTRGSPLAAGLDLHSTDRTIIGTGERKLIGTGWALQIPVGWYGRIAPRSGLAWKSGVDVLAGVIDADFRGELKVVLINLGTEPFRIAEGDRIAQLIIEACANLSPLECTALPDTARGTGGFGSSGTGLREVV